MADKYLSEKEWKSASKGTAWKADPMAKALAAFEKADKSGPQDGLKALDEVQKQADLLGKSAKGDKALTTWLGHLDKSIGSQRKDYDKAVADAAKATQAAKDAGNGESEDDEENAAAAVLLDPKRLRSQFQTLKRNPQRRAQFAFVASKTESGFTLSPKVAGRKLFAKLSDALDSKVGTFGLAWLDGTTLVLQIDKAMGGVVKKVRAPIKACGFRVAKVVLWDAEGQVLEEDLADEQDLPAPEGEPSDTASEAQRSEDPQRTRYEARLKALARPLQQALDGAHPAAAKLRELLNFAKGKADGGQFGAGLQALEVLAKLLGQGSDKNAPTPTPSDVPKKADYARCAQAWSVTRTRVSDDLKKLREAILSEFAASPLLGEINARIGRLDDVALRLDDQLEAILSQAGAAAEEAERIRLHRQAAQSIQRMLSQLDTDPILSRLKDNPFVPIDPRAALGATLQVLSKQVA
ncbi:hypothetical protein KAK06_11700 [Ideonella sp. 4Y11]|uniref:Uncharacterized protein n=1 Tax=Ideonella aquatica TaxID=2824119 RepID=A0A941BQW5_9BURK|nr:hypothetical protein [Ideonella aquatica]MBQ0959610.1 hypothetical protein [Ideonella aquatica]